MEGSSNKDRHRIGLLGIYHETNTFIDSATTLEDFRSGYWLAGDAIRGEYGEAYHEISGVIAAVDAEPDMELVPVLYVSATPGGMIGRDDYEHLLEEMWRALDAAMPLDGCVVVPHGAGVADGYADMDGHWLSLLRKKLGNIPICGTLDPHANVSPAMARATDALVAYETNPHVDQRETGRKAAAMLIGMLRGQTRPVQRLVQLPLAISIEQQYTSKDPCKSLYAYIRKIVDEYQLLSASVLLGFPYADVKEMGSGFLLVAEGSEQNAAERLEHAAGKLTGYVMSSRMDFNGEKRVIGRVGPEIAWLEKPVLLLDMGDNVGGGAPGNSTHLLEYFEEQRQTGIFICIDDAQAVRESMRHGMGERFEIAIGPAGNKYRVMVEIQQCNDGIFTEETPKHGGFVNYDMGPTAVVRTLNGNTVMLTSRRTPPYSLRQMTAFGLQTADFEVIIAKGVNAPIAAYAPVCRSIVQVDTPGVTQADMTLFDYKNRRKPMFPFEK